MGVEGIGGSERVGEGGEMWMRWGWEGSLGRACRQQIYKRVKIMKSTSRKVDMGHLLNEY